MPIKIANHVLAVLDQATLDGPKLVLSGQLDRKTYEAVAKIIEAAGGKWNRKAKAHIFDGDAADAIEPILLTGEVTRTKQEFGQFYTPPPLAKRIVDMAGIVRGTDVLEPSAGRGAIAAEALLRGAIVDCVEIDKRNVDILCSTSYNRVVHGDFLQQKPGRIFQVAAMNPPFAKRADIWHVLHAAKFVEPGGKVVSVMSAGIQFRQDKLTMQFQDFLADHGGDVEPLPEDTFKESGTSVNTVLVSFTV